MFRVDSSLYFANMTFLEGKVCEEITGNSKITSVVFDFSGENSIDAVAIHSLEEMMTNCREGEVTFLFANIKGPVLDLLHKANWSQKYSGQYEFMSIDAALKAIER